MSRHQLSLVVAALAAFKSLEYALVDGFPSWLVLGGLLLLGAVWTPLRPRAGMAVVAAGALVVNLTSAYRNHMALLVWVALALAIFSDDHHARIALRCQLTLMYGFAALAKVWPEWLSGAALAESTWVGSLLPERLVVAVAWATVVVEAVLAVAVWSRRRAWVLLAAATHLSFVVFIYEQPWNVARLVVFGVLSVATWLYASRAYSPPPRVGSATAPSAAR